MRIKIIHTGRVNFKLPLILCLFVLCMWTAGYAQPSFRSYERRTAGVDLNFHWMQMKDALFSPLLYNGPGGEINLRSARNYLHMRRHLYVGTKADYLFNRLDFNAFYVQPSVGGGLTFLSDALSTDNSLSYIGGSLNGTARISRFLNEDPDHIYWTTYYTVDFNYFLDVELKKEKKIFLELKVPLAGVLSRPDPAANYSYQLPGLAEYARRLHENMGFVTLDNMQAANMRVIMDLYRTRRNSVSLGYEVDFARFTIPGTVLYFSNSLFIRIFFDVMVW